MKTHEVARGDAESAEALQTIRGSRVKEGWETKKLGALCDILDSQRKPITKKDRIPGKHPYYGATGIQDYVEGYLFDEPLILVGEDGAKWESGEATAFAITGKCWVNNHAHVLRPHRSTVTDKWLVFYLVHSDLSEYVSGLTVPKLNQGSLREIPIPVPPLPEQQRIVRILDEAFAAIATAKANAEKNLKNARALFESYLEAVFRQRGEGWEEKRLGDVATLRSGTTVNAKLEKPTGRFPYVKVADMSFAGNESEIVTSSRFLEETDVGRNAVIPAGTTIFPKRGGAILTNKKRLTAVPICVDLNIMGVIPGSKLLPDYLYLYFINVDMRRLGNWSSIPQINNYDIEPLSIVFPAPLDQQAKIVGEVRALGAQTQRLESINQRKLAALDELKKSLLHQAFKGEL